MAFDQIRMPLEDRFGHTSRTETRRRLKTTTTTATVTAFPVETTEARVADEGIGEMSTMPTAMVSTSNGAQSQKSPKNVVSTRI